MGEISGKKFLYKEIIIEKGNSQNKISFSVEGSFTIKGEISISTKGYIKKMKLWDISKGRVSYIRNEDDDIILSVNSLSGELLQEIPLDEGASSKFLLPSCLCQWQFLIKSLFLSPNIVKAAIAVSVPFYENTSDGGSIFMKDLPENTSFSSVKVKFKKTVNKDGFLFTIKPLNITILTDKDQNILSFQRDKVKMSKK
ncbi:hypothetical protein J7L48_02015 [bacterium]|nr:hypothetical protein [bacterium]